MSSWAEIESIAETLASPVAGAARATEGVHVVVSRPIGRLRRQHRPVLGSIDSAGAMLQHNGRAVIVGSAFILVPGLVLTVVGAALTYDRFSSLSSSVRTVPELFGLGGAAVGVERVVWFLSIVFQSLAASCVGGYVATLVVQRQVGTEVSAKAAFRPFIRRLPALCVAWFFGHIWVFPILWLISRVAQPAAIVVLGAPIAVCMLALTLLVAPSVAIEGLGPFHGLRRGWQLGRRKFGLAFAFVLGSAIVGAYVQYGITILPRLISGLGLIPIGRFVWLLEAVAGQLARLLSVPLVALATTFVYLDVRITTEGMDLLIDADHSFGINK